MFSIDDPDFFTNNGLGFWIVIWTSLLLILGQVLAKIHLKGRFTISRRTSSIIAITVTIIVTQLSLVSYAGLFMHSTYTDICLGDAVTQEPINKTRVEQCVIGGNDMQLKLFLLGGIATTILVFVQIWQLSRDANDNKKNEITLDTKKK